MDLSRGLRSRGSQCRNIPANLSKVLRVRGEIFHKTKKFPNDTSILFTGFSLGYKARIASR